RGKAIKIIPQTGVGLFFSTKGKKIPVKTFFLAIVFVCGLCLAAQSQGTPISPLIMGQSYHYTKWTAPSLTPAVTFNSTEWGNVSISGSKLIRCGGKQYNIGAERPMAGQEVYYVSIVDDIRKNGCEPVLTLPFLH